MRRGHFDAEIAFVVLQPNVIARLVLLDEIVFEDQRLFIRDRNQRLRCVARGTAPAIARPRC